MRPLERNTRPSRATATGRAPQTRQTPLLGVHPIAAMEPSQQIRQIGQYRSLPSHCKHQPNRGDKLLHPASRCRRRFRARHNRSAAGHARGRGFSRAAQPGRSSRTSSTASHVACQRVGRGGGGLGEVRRAGMWPCQSGRARPMPWGSGRADAAISECSLTRPRAGQQAHPGQRLDRAPGPMVNCTTGGGAGGPAAG